MTKWLLAVAFTALCACPILANAQGGTTPAPTVTSDNNQLAYLLIIMTVILAFVGAAPHVRIDWTPKSAGVLVARFGASSATGRERVVLTPLAGGGFQLMPM